MRHMAIALVSCACLSLPALGAEGDVLTVTGDNVNVRTGPGVDRSVSRQVDRDQRVIEIARERDWIHAEIEGAGGAEGWIHGSLLTPALPEVAQAKPSDEAPPEATGPAATAVPDDAPEPASDAAPAPDTIAPAAASGVDPADLQRFRDSVEYLNSRALAVTGVDLFTQVEPLGGGAVQVGATDAWASMPPAGQRSYANTLLDRWAAATGSSEPVKVQIVDDSGQVIMEESKP
jgi:hypothetical protein